MTHLLVALALVFVAVAAWLTWKKLDTKAALNSRPYERHIGEVLHYGLSGRTVEVTVRYGASETSTVRTKVTKGQRIPYVKEGTEVPVFVNPNYRKQVAFRPARAVDETNAFLGGFLVLAFGVLAVGLSAVTWL